MKKIVLYILIISCIKQYAQNETINWYFGNKAGLNFDLGQRNVLANSQMNTPAGSTSISNAEGLLMFYSDGQTIWNRAHEILENGTDLAGDNNNYQSAIIIPNPVNEQIYYLFYSRVNKTTNSTFSVGLYYSEIRFTNQNPLGIVTIKNQFLGEQAPDERFTAVHHKNGESFWLITLRGIDSDPEKDKRLFKVYNITENGVNSNSVDTQLDISIANKSAMKISVDGSKLLVTGNSTNQDLRYVHEFNFNNETGTISLVRNIILEPPFPPQEWLPRGIEISPNGEFAYIGFSAPPGDAILQLELNPTDVSTEPRVLIHIAPPGVNVESLQLANDQKIYVALKNEEENIQNIGVISFPNEKGIASNYSNRGIITPAFSRKGLPTFVQSFFASKINAVNQCFTKPFTFSADSYTFVSGVSWDFGDGNTATGLQVNHTYNAPGNYIVQGKLSVGSKIVTVYKTVTAFELPNLTPNQVLEECDDDSDGFTTFNLNSIRNKITNPALEEQLLFYLSQDDLDNDIQIPNPERFENTSQNQEIFVKAINENGCEESSSFTLNAKFVPLNNISDFFTCENSDFITGNNQGRFDLVVIEQQIRDELNIPRTTTLSFHKTRLDAQTNVNAIEDEFVTSSTTLFIKGQEADLSCAGIQEFNLIVNSNLFIDLEDEYTICFDPNLKDPIIVDVGSQFDRYEWKNASGFILSNSQEYTVNAVGEFSVTVYKTENGITCSNEKIFRVVNPEPPSFLNVDVNTEDETNNIVSVEILGNSSYEFSLDNENYFGNGTSYTFTNVTAGLKTLFVRDLNECEQPIETKVSVIGFKKFFTPNGDGRNDYWNINGLDASNFQSINVRIFDRFGNLIYRILDFSTLGWDGTINGNISIENNYWFKAQIVDRDDNIIKKTGNFSLIRD